MSHSHGHSHECDHDHACGHAHGHDHAHPSDDYFLDQLCLIALSGAFGAICLTMFFWKNSYLGRILASQFYNFILASGVVLLVLFVIRAVAVWKLAGEAKDHDHGHAHHGAGHGHHHGHGHAHDADHEHGFAPWRYVVLIIPVVLFFLDLPREKKVGKVTFDMDMTQEAKMFATMLAIGPDPLAQVAMLPGAEALMADVIDPAEVESINFKVLEESAYVPAAREFSKGKPVAVIAKFVKNPASDHVFKIARFRIQCCGSDAIPLLVDVVCKEPVAGFQKDEWVEVTGRIDYVDQGNGRFVTILRAPKSANVKRVPPPVYPYVE